jgi:hypothetical protein
VHTVYPSVKGREAEARAAARKAMVQASAAIWQATIEALQRDYPAVSLPRLPEY